MTVTTDTGAMMTPAEREQLARALGNLILDQLPYGADLYFPADLTLPSTLPLPTEPGPSDPPSVTIPPGYKAVRPVERDGFYETNTAANPYRPIGQPTNGQIADLDIMNQGELKYWEMKDSPHQITKAIRIWYTYVETNAAGLTRPRGTWLMIGYSGNGH